MEASAMTLRPASNATRPRLQSSLGSRVRSTAPPVTLDHRAPLGALQHFDRLDIESIRDGAAFRPTYAIDKQTHCRIDRSKTN
jgi:hypothetical protein